MLTPEQLANIADSITPVYSDYGKYVAKKISKTLERLDKTDDAGLIEWFRSVQRESEKLYSEIQREAGRLSSSTQNDVAGVMATAANDSIEFDKVIYRAAGRSAAELTRMPQARRLLIAGIDKTNGLISNLTKTTALSAQRIFINAASTAEMQVASGAYDYNTAIKNAIIRAAKDGRYVLYPTGHKDSVDVAVRRAVRTGVSQTTGVLSLYNAQMMGNDLMQISAHYGARPEHAEWQGKIVSLSGRKGYLTLSDIGYGTGAGFKGWNCRHDWYPYFEGISVNQYTPEKLDEYADKLLYYDGNYIPYYDATQMVRRQERELRKLDREIAGLDTDLTRDACEQKKRLRVQYEKALKDFCKQTGLTYRLQSTINLVA